RPGRRHAFPALLRPAMERRRDPGKRSRRHRPRRSRSRRHQARPSGLSMHLLAAQPGTIVDGSAAVDLGQTPGDIVVLTAADSELASLAAARSRLGADFPRVRLANLLHLGHNMSVDLYV